MNDLERISSWRRASSNIKFLLAIDLVTVVFWQRTYYSLVITSNSSLFHNSLTPTSLLACLFRIYLLFIKYNIINIKLTH